MAFYRAQLRLHRTTGVPADDVINVWHFDSDAGSASVADVESIRDQLTAFYQAVDVYISGLVTTTPTLTIYDLSEAEPRIPLVSYTLSLTLGTSSIYPAEIAQVLSFQGAVESGVNMRRRRGRIYLGPLVNVSTETSDGDTRPNSTRRTDMANAAAAMIGGPGSGLPVWAVFSPTTYAERIGAGDTVAQALDAAFEDVVSGWVDNAFDTQRRRGASATTRTLFS